MGVVSMKLQWALKHLVAEPAVKQRKAVLGEAQSRHDIFIDMYMKNR